MCFLGHGLTLSVSQHITRSCVNKIYLNKRYQSHTQVISKQGVIDKYFNKFGDKQYDHPSRIL
jgi:hypothetical protein